MAEDCYSVTAVPLVIINSLVLILIILNFQALQLFTRINCTDVFFCEHLVTETVLKQRKTEMQSVCVPVNYS